MPTVTRHDIISSLAFDVSITYEDGRARRDARSFCDCPQCRAVRRDAERIEEEQQTANTPPARQDPNRSPLRSFVYAPPVDLITDEPEGVMGVVSTCSRCGYEDCECWECPRCEEYFRPGRGGHCSDCERCESCCECSRYASGRVFDYSEKAETRFGFFPKRETLPDNGRSFLYLGIELECERKTNCDNNLEDTVVRLEACEHYANWALCKHDGSLDYGFEVVSAPSDLAEHKKRWPTILKIVRRDMSAWRRPSTGLHVHLSRSWFSSLDLAKFVYFINAEENRHYIVALAGRTSPDYGRLRKKKLCTDLLYNDARYEAVNLGNARTIEVRIFKGTLNTQHVLANLEFCHALANYVKQASIQQCIWSEFWAYVTKHEKTYKHLADYIRVAEPKLRDWIVKAAIEDFFEYTEHHVRPEQYRDLDTERELSQINEPVYTNKKKEARSCA